MTQPTLSLAQQEIAVPLQTAQQLLTTLQNFVIQNDDQQGHIVNVLREVKQHQRALEERRITFTKPLHELKTNIDALFRTPRQKLEELEKLCKTMITTYMQAKQARNVAAIQAAAVAPTPVVAQQTLARVQPVEAPQSVSVRYVWQFQITQPELVPAQFLSPDPAKIQAYLAQTSQPAIPGVTFSQKAITSVRSR